MKYQAKNNPAIVINARTNNSVNPMIIKFWLLSFDTFSQEKVTK
jgi:hypothetical protein